MSAIARAIRETFVCSACGKRTIVLNVAGARRRPQGEAVSSATHCACPGGPAAEVRSC